MSSAGYTELGGSARTRESLRAEDAHDSWEDRAPSERPLTSGAKDAATRLFSVLKAHGVTKSRLALMLGVHEKQVRKYLDLRAYFPADGLRLLPLEMAVDYVLDSLISQWGARRVLGFVLSRVLDHWSTDGAVQRADRRVLRDANKQIDALLDRLAEEDSR